MCSPGPRQPRSSGFTALVVWQIREALRACSRVLIKCIKNGHVLVCEVGKCRLWDPEVELSRDLILVRDGAQCGQTYKLWLLLSPFYHPGQCFRTRKKVRWPDHSVTIRKRYQVRQLGDLPCRTPSAGQDSGGGGAALEKHFTPVFGVPNKTADRLETAAMVAP